MPEGDTIFRIARNFQRALAGQQVVLFEAAYAQLARVDDESPIVGRTIERAEAHGKWLLIYLSGDLILATHLRMKGSWHLYRPGDRWQLSRQRMRIHLQTPTFEAVGFDIPVAEFYTKDTLARQSMIPKLGPDLLQENFAPNEAAERICSYPEEEIGDVLLNQRVLAGIGNIYKSEVCFACRVNPFRRVRELTTQEIDCLLERARKLMSMNVSEGSGNKIVTYSGLRQTTRSMDPGVRLWVYRRAGEPCRRCGTEIQMRKQGFHARSTYWCPECQKGSPDS